MYHSRWKGSHYEAGFQYGNKLCKNGKNPLKHILISEERKLFAEKSIPLYEAVYPEILEEIKGTADGLRIDFKEIANFLFSMYCFVFDNKCSCFAFSENGKTVLGKNSDFITRIEKLCDSPYYNLDGAYSFIGNTTAWTEVEDGVNEHGLAAGLTFIYPVKIAAGLNAGMLVRYLLEKCKTTKEAIKALQKLPIASSQTITLADKSGEIAVVECNCENVVVLKPQNNRNAVFTTNHFVSDEMQIYQYDGVDDCHSQERYETLAAAFRNFHKGSVTFAKDLLAGKKGFMCQYDRSQGLDTVWSSIYDLTDNTIYRAEGNPARKPFQEDHRQKKSF